MGKNKHKKRIKTEDGGLVYSTDKEVMNSLWEGLNDLLPEEKTKKREKPLLRIRKEKKGRAGKTVTIIAYEHLNKVEVEGLVKEIKKQFATGGSLKNDEIVIQGELLERLQTFLKEKGYRVK